MRSENESVRKTPTAPSGAGSAAGLGVTPADLEKLRRAVRNEDYVAFREIVSDYLADRGFNAWWEGLVLVAYFSEAKDVIRALKELFRAAKIPADMVAWPSGGYGPVKIGLDLPWGEGA
jgi:hypothetical protein